MKQARLKQNCLVIKIQEKDQEEFNKLLKKIKNLPGASFDWKKKEWNVANNSYSRKKLKELGFRISPKASIKKITKIEKPKNVKIEPFPFQMEAVQFLDNNNGNVLIADQTGLGKTIETILFINERLDLRPVLIVCPSSVKYNWQEELMKVAGFDSYIIEGRKGEIQNDHDIYIINYEILKDRLNILLKMNFRYLVADEAHRLKNFNAKRTKAFSKLNKSNVSTTLLTATPIQNRHHEYFNIIRQVDSSLFPSHKKFCNRFCPGRTQKFWNKKRNCMQSVQVYDRNTNGDELHEILSSTIMIRRLTEDVFDQLPEVTHSTIYLPLSNRDKYSKAEQSTVKYLEENPDEVQHKLELLRQLTNEGKEKEAKEWLIDHFENNEQSVIFTMHRNTADMLSKLLKFPKIEGGVSQKKRQQLCNLFQSKQIQGIIVNIQAGGEGINLQSASNAIFYELPYIPAQVTQCIGRINRIGQKSKHLNAYYLVGKNSIEGYIMGMLSSKQEVLDTAVDGKDVMKEIMSQLTDKKGDTNGNSKK